MTEPASLAVAAVLAVVCAAVAGPAFAFQSHPFNQGVNSLAAVYDFRSFDFHPLADYLANVPPTIALLTVALACATWALLRARETIPPWVRPAAAEALVVTLALGLVVCAGGYRASTLDLTNAQPATASAATGWTT